MTAAINNASSSISAINYSKKIRPNENLITNGVGNDVNYNGA